MIASDTPVWLPIVLSVLGGGVIGASVTALVNWRLGVRGHEREARKDEREADDKMLGRALARIERLEERESVHEARLDEMDRRLRVRGDYIDTLEHHIWQGFPPPPPARPDGL